MLISNKRSGRRASILLIIEMLVLTSILLLVPHASADTQIKLIIDGRNIAASAAPMIRNDRTLVPLRVVSEELGADVTWNGVDGTVNITKGKRAILLRIDRNLIEYTIDGVKNYNLSDVKPQIFSDRTFVPLRLIGNALGVGVYWDGATRTVSINSTESSSITDFYNMNISSVQQGEAITETTMLQASLPSPMPAGAAEIKYLLISPDTGLGFIIARGNDLAGGYQWLPAMRDNGEKVLVAALYDSSGKLLAGDAIPVQIGIVPNVALIGLVQNQTVNDSVSLGANLNFSAAYVKYEITNSANGKVILTTEQDPFALYQWTPPMEYNGNVTAKVIAFDHKDQPYPGQAVSLKVEMPQKLALTGVKSGQTVDKPVTLSVLRNFDVIETEYFLRDVLTGAEQSLWKGGYASYTWFPGPGISGNKELFVRVKATDGSVYTSDAVPVYISGAKLLLQGAGPNQVITSAAAAHLKVASNVTLNSVKYVMTNSRTGLQKIITEMQDATQGFTYTPAQGDGGSWRLKAIGSYGTGQTISTEEVIVTIYTGKVHSSMPIIEKSKFLSMASQLAVADSKKSGMSAALQTAQAILETGWGQSVPVDIYSGQLSYNLFGIKGTGAAGSVTSNTWEEYNGAKYRIDAKFRAYHNVGESWADHNKLLLTGTRYESYRKVMYDSSLAAWALRRAGYATDSKYPVKLMEIIELYKLEALDEVSI